MKFEVKRRFKLKPSNKRYRRGGIFETDSESLADQLRSLGFLGKRYPDPKPTFIRKEPIKCEDSAEDLEDSAEDLEDSAEDLEESEPVHVGGGWYLLSDGRKVRKSQLDEE